MTVSYEAHEAQVYDEWATDYEERAMDDHLREVIESVVDGWYPEGRIDWDDFLYRVEKMADVDLPTDMLSPAIKAIKNYVRQYRSL
jgi:hypothetical protein